MSVEERGRNVSRESLPDDLAGQLLQAIIDGRHRPNALLPPEAELAEEADVSRLTVREAVKTLRAKNVVRIERGRGTFVNPPSRWTDLEALLHAAVASRSTPDGVAPRRLIETRRILEVGAAELAAVRRSDDHLDTLEAEVERMRAAADAGDVDVFVAADIAFHAAVLDAAGNVFLAALYDPLRQLLLTARRQTSAYEEIRRHAIEQHEAVLAAIRDGSSKRAGESMRSHMDQTERDLDTYVLGSGG
jgi:GntR family transcriptional repressor for pyruvate dehydrogenase complex